jgi:hypothetical protein
MRNMLPDKCYMDLARRCQTFVEEYGVVGTPYPAYPEEERSQITKVQIYNLAKNWILSIESLCTSLEQLIPSAKNSELDSREYQEARDKLTKIVLMAELADTYLRASLEHPTKKPYAQIGKPKKIEENKVRQASFAGSNELNTTPRAT